MKCKLTHEEGKSAKAHIIPKSFFRIDYSFKNPLKLHTNVEGEYPKRCHAGIYDETIVTEKGEKYFDPWDDYACKLLIEDIGKFEPLVKEGKIIAYQNKQYDYQKLKLFFLSLLWRAHHSTHNFFKKVNIGPHEKTIRNAILNNKPGGEELYSINLAIFDDMKNGAPLLDPFPERYSNIKYYRFFISNIIAYIKVDKQVSAYPFRETQLTPDRSIIIIKRTYLKSNEYKVAQGVI